MFSLVWEDDMGSRPALMHNLQTEHGTNEIGEYFFTQKSSWSLQLVVETHLGCCVWGLNCGPTLFYSTFLCPSRHQYGLFLGPFQCSPRSFLCAHFHVHTCLWFIAFATQAFLKQILFQQPEISKDLNKIGDYLYVLLHFSQNMR